MTKKEFVAILDGLPTGVAMIVHCGPSRLGLPDHHVTELLIHLDWNVTAGAATGTGNRFERHLEDWQQKKDSERRWRPI